MILTWNQIKTEYESGKIFISNFQEYYITTNSYDLTLWNQFIRYDEKVLDIKKENKHSFFELSDHKPLMLKKWDFLLWSSKEMIGSDYYVPIIHNKSSIARLGLFIHITADLIDIWSIGAITFQLYATLPVTIYPWMLIAQVSFWKTKWTIQLYQWKYQNSSGPRPSYSFKDYI